MLIVRVHSLEFIADLTVRNARVSACQGQDHASQPQLGHRVDPSPARNTVVARVLAGPTYHLLQNCARRSVVKLRVRVAPSRENCVIPFHEPPSVELGSAKRPELGLAFCCAYLCPP